MRPRLVDVNSETYEVARRYMIRLEQERLRRPRPLENLAAVVKMAPGAVPRALRVPRAIAVGSGQWIVGSGQSSELFCLLCPLPTVHCPLSGE